MEALLFGLFAVVAIVSAILMVVFRNPVHSALSLVTTFFALAGLYVLLQAHFLAAVQIIVYTGAIMVLFLFVIMLLNLGHSEALEPMPRPVRRLTVLLLMALMVAQIGLVGLRGLDVAAASGDRALFQDNVATVGRMLYTDYLFAIQVVGMILLVALVGVIVLVKRDKDTTTAVEGPQGD